MPNGLKRYQQSKHFHFIIFSCYKRQLFLHTTAAKDTVLQILDFHIAGPPRLRRRPAEKLSK
jgi:hypothetical protein